MLLSLVTAVATFLLCAWIARILTRPIAHMHWLLQDMHDAFAFTDPHVIVAFVVGLACSAALLYRFGAFQTPPALHQNEWRAFKLIERTRVSHSSSVYRFAIPHQLGLPIGQHVSIRASIDGKPMVRSYTPISDHTATGHVDFLVKTYEKGNVSRAFDRLVDRGHRRDAHQFLPMTNEPASRDRNDEVLAGQLDDGAFRDF